MECHKWKSRRMLEKQIRRQQQRRRKKIELQKHKKKLKKNKTEKKIPLSIVCRCNTKILSVKLVAASLRYYSTFYSIQPFAFRNFVLVSVLCAWARFLWPTLLLLGIQVILNYLFFLLQRFFYHFTLLLNSKLFAILNICHIIMIIDPMTVPDRSQDYERKIRIFLFLSLSQSLICCTHYTMLTGMRDFFRLFSVFICFSIFSLFIFLLSRFWHFIRVGINRAIFLALSALVTNILDYCYR